MFAVQGLFDQAAFFVVVRVSWDQLLTRMKKTTHFE